MTSPINHKSLKDQVYDYLRLQLRKGRLKPGDEIKMDKTAQILGVSKTPLRDALLQLAMENFVTIKPRRGVFVNPLTLEDIKNAYEIIGALESLAILKAGPNLAHKDIEIMERLIEGMKRAITRDDFDTYYEKNLEFHNIYLNHCHNPHLIRIVNTLKKRLYDFPRQTRYIREWEENSIEEHEKLLNLLKEKRYEEAANYIRDVHWSFEVQKKFILQYYPQVNSGRK
ncbi:MAG: GntR family transcriptional regulator [Candidatus Aminicenantes bacterium]|nr:GntR family transcriptional regulator [Candidatus Aminicenantes bacterium]